MRQRLPVSIPTLVLIVIGGAVLIGVIAAGATSGAAFNTYNPSWEGTSELRTQTAEAGSETSVLTNVDRYGTTDANGTVAFILAPDEPYSAEDAEQVRTFVQEGGTLVVADDIDEPANGLLADLGVSTRIDGDPLRDERNYYRSPSLPVATNASAHPYVEGIETFTINHGTSLESGETEILLESSEYAYLDRNRNEELNDNEELQARPVATREDVGAGQVVVVSDASALINVMLDREGNQAFVTRIAADHDRTIIDTSHSSSLPPLVGALLLIRDSAILQLGIGIAVLLSLGAWQRGSFTEVSSRLAALSPWSRSSTQPSADRPLTAGEIDAWLDREYPDWDEQRRETVMTAVIDRQSKPTDNE